MKAKDKVVKNGVVYYSVAGTAELLGTTKPKLREIMGRNELEWTQFELNGSIFVTAISIAAYLKRGKR